MLKSNKKTAGLENSVQWCIDNIKNIYTTGAILGDLGIRVVGQAETAEELPPAATYDGIYGDAYLIGTKTPYDYYIFTRPFTGEDEPQWFNIGKFPLAGPPGPNGVGLPGPTGSRGSRWFSGPIPDPASSTYEEGDLWLITNLPENNPGIGDLYQIKDGEWILITNIRGPVGR